MYDEEAYDPENAEPGIPTTDFDPSYNPPEPVTTDFSEEQGTLETEECFNENNVPINVKDNSLEEKSDKVFVEDDGSEVAHDRDSMEAQVEFPIGTTLESSENQGVEYEAEEMVGEIPSETLIDFAPNELNEKYQMNNSQNYDGNVTQNDSQPETANDTTEMSYSNNNMTCHEEHLVSIAPTEKQDLPPEPPAPLIDYNYSKHADEPPEISDDQMFNTSFDNQEVETNAEEAFKNDQKTLHVGNVPTQEFHVKTSQENFNCAKLNMDNEQAEMHKENMESETSLLTEGETHDKISCPLEPEAPPPPPPASISKETNVDNQNEMQPAEHSSISDSHILTTKTEDVNNKNHAAKGTDEVIVVEALPGKENGKTVDGATEPSKSGDRGTSFLKLSVFITFICRFRCNLACYRMHFIYFACFFEIPFSHCLHDLA